VGSFELDENGEAGLLIAHDTEPMYICLYDEKTFFLRWERATSKFWVQSFQNTKGISVQVESTTFVSFYGTERPKVQIFQIVVGILPLKISDSGPNSVNLKNIEYLSDLRTICSIFEFWRSEQIQNLKPFIFPVPAMQHSYFQSPFWPKLS
jgi:hypothetical protein